MPVSVIHINGRRHDLFNLTENDILAEDRHLMNLEFGYLQRKVAHGRTAGYDRLDSLRVLDDLVGQPPREKAGAA